MTEADHGRPLGDDLLQRGKPEDGLQSRQRLISGLVLDRDLSPRARIGSNHVRQLAEALRSGKTLPPIVVERTTSRVVDGFHRIEAHKRIHGKEALIEVTEKDYNNEADLFVDAMELNSHHGQRLATYDQLRCIGIAEQLSIDYDRLAGALSVRPGALSVRPGALSVRPSYVGDLSARRMGTELGTRSPIPLKRTIEHMRGKALTKAQMEANQKLSGQSQAYTANQLILLIENNLLDTEDENLMRRIGYLKYLLDGVETLEPGS